MCTVDCTLCTPYLLCWFQKNKHESANKLRPRMIYCRNSSFNIYYIFNIDFLCNQITQNDITNKCSILILSEKDLPFLCVVQWVVKITLITLSDNHIWSQLLQFYSLNSISSTKPNQIQLGCDPVEIKFCY